MIRINRPALPPDTLSSKGLPAKASLCEMYDANSSGYDSGTVKFPTANGRIYGAKTVRDELKACQKNKCCYSEAKFVRDAVSVEHFRPKAAIGERGSNNKNYPGYYWLAYEWTNLMLCKHGVNSDKKDYFPLLNEHDRANNHHGDVSQEQPMIIDPTSEDPRDHIRFHNDEPEGITERGEFTVNLLLRHPDLEEDRREYFNILKGLKQAIEVLVDTGNADSIVATSIQAKLNKAKQSDAKYSSMAIDLLS